MSVNEETKDPDKTPGRAAIISTVMLLVTYALVIFAAQSFAGVGDKGIGLGNPAQRRRRALACSATPSSAAPAFGSIVAATCCC